MSDLLGQARFSVTTLLDARREDLQAGLDRFVEGVRKSGARWVFFYYAGHGAQVDWRNYLLPVDAQVDDAEQLRQSCIDLNQLVQRFEAGKGTSFVVILDACRNNPFGSRYQPSQRGLSQFDAPSGTLLAYATAPGNTAADGQGRNGLYTENLVRELAVPGARIEDALKRVRLSVRLASQGAQVPWETTSLEEDLVLFGEKASEGDQPRVIDAERNQWTRLQASTNPQDWIQYLQANPAGRFAEIAQVRLFQLLTSGKGVAQTGASSGLELGAGLPVPTLIEASKNPYSAGLYPMARRFSVGDRAAYRTSNLMTDVVDRRQTIYTVSEVNAQSGLVTLNDGDAVTDLLGNFIQPIGSPVSDVPQQICPAEIQIGKTWKAGWKQQNARWGEEYVSLNLRVAALEKVTVPAGEFLAFRVDVTGWHSVSRGTARHEQKLWLIPGINFLVKSELKVWHPQVTINADRMELVSLHQKVFDLGCGDGRGQRNLSVQATCT